MEKLFSSKSEIIQIAKMNLDLLVSLWRTVKKHEAIARVILLLPVLFYSVICFFLMVSFSMASVIDFISHGIAYFAHFLKTKLDEIIGAELGGISVIFLPPFVFLVGFLMLVAVLLPKTVASTHE